MGLFYYLQAIGRDTQVNTTAIVFQSRMLGSILLFPAEIAYLMSTLDQSLQALFTE